MTQQNLQETTVAKAYWVYILHCDNDSYYTGYTVDLARRYQDHMNGKAKYTRSFKPLTIAQAWRVSGEKSEAMKLENFIKKLSRPEKLHLLAHPESLMTGFTSAATITAIDSAELAKCFLPENC